MKSVTTNTNFNEELFGCFSDMKLCLFAGLFPGGICCLQAAAVDKAYGQGKLVPYLFPLCFLCIGGGVNRLKIRERFGIEGSCIKDSSIWFIFSFCASLQEYKESQRR